MADKKDASTILGEARERASTAKDAWSEVYTKAKDDLRFLSDEEAAQWDEKEYRERKNAGRPVITVDRISQFVHQVENDIRMNTPTIRVIPHSSDSDADTAEIISGKIKDIEYQSGADEAYDTAASFAVRSSIGFITVDHDYAEKKGFNQEFCIRRVVNPCAVLIDPASIEVDGSDAEYGFIFDTMTVKEFKRRWPGKEVCSFDDDAGESKSREDGDNVIVAQYFWVEKDEREEVAEDYIGEDEAPKRMVQNKKVMRARLSGKEILDEGEPFPGEYIPIVPVYGEEAWMDGKRHLNSLVRKAKEPAYMSNLWSSLETEILMKQPLAPVTAPAGQVENYSQDWLDPAKAGVLRYDTVDSNGVPIPGAPQRLMPPQFPAGFAQAKAGAMEDIRNSTGMYNASLGQRSNETSGIAINARKVEGDMATFHFADNLNKAIAQVGRIIVSGLSSIYDSRRTIRIIDEEENPKMVGINGNRVEGQDRDYDFTNGEYSVRVITGPSFTTQRQEAVQYLADIMAQQPQLAQIAGDLLFKNMDFPGAQGIADRIKKTIPAHLLDDAEGEQDPEKIQLQQTIEQGKQMLAQMQQEMADMKRKLDAKEADLAIKAQSERNDTQIEMQKLRLDELKMQSENQFKAAEIAMQERELTLREQELQMKLVGQNTQQPVQQVVG